MSAGDRLRVGWRAVTPSGRLERWIVAARDAVPDIANALAADGVMADHEVRVAIADADGIAATKWKRTRTARLSQPLPELADDEPGDWAAEEARVAAGPAADSEVRAAVARAVAAGAMSMEDAIALMATLATALEDGDD